MCYCFGSRSFGLYRTILQVMLARLYVLMADRCCSLFLKVGSVELESRHYFHNFYLALKKYYICPSKKNYCKYQELYLHYLSFSIISFFSLNNSNVFLPSEVVLIHTGSSRKKNKNKTVFLSIIFHPKWFSQFFFSGEIATNLPS